MFPSSEHDQRLAGLWSRRSQLNEQEWHQLYQLVWAILYAYIPRELSGLPAARDMYIQDFFVDKVFKDDAAADGQQIHSGALRFFYRNYLRDELRSERHTVELFVSSAADDSGCCDGALDAASETAEQNALRMLADSGKSIEALSAAADGWLARMPAWVTVYLGLNYCPDTETSEALVHLAKRMRIASYHSKAAQLGFNWSRNKLGNGSRPFEETMLGQFIQQDADIDISRENEEIMLLTFKILCHQALLRSEQMKDEL